MPLKPTNYMIINVKDIFCNDLLSYSWARPVFFNHDIWSNNYSPRNIKVDMICNEITYMETDHDP